MKTFVADACALIAYLFDEEGSDLFESPLIQVRNNENIGHIIYGRKRTVVRLL
ncbi:hypothetical protein QUF80_05925 [Desulfococcaceae bacterium HSG8]|nr:hypothetical protein [Desulfococcaceae bacterium HSG8]